MGLFDKIRGGDEERVAFIGIDGVPHSLVENNPDVFPNLAEIEDAGDAGAIESIVPPESSACWPSLTTGKNPGETGVYGFTDRETGSYDTYVPMGRDVQVDRVWDRVTADGRDATVMNVPVSFPPQRDVQRMVSGFLSPGVDKAAYPDEFRDDLQSMDYRLDPNPKLGHKDDKTEFIDDAHEVLEKRFEAFKRYIRADDWDLFFGVFMSTDRVNHFLFEHYTDDGEYREEFLEFYRTLDDYIGRLREELDDDVSLLIASDHGFTKLDHEVHLNTWLAEQGWLDFEEDDHDDLGDISDDTRAYSFIPGRIYLNLEGREPRGAVPEAEYEETRAELKELLEGLEGPNGEPVCERVVEREKAFDGAHDDIAPDLVAVPHDGFDLKASFRPEEEVFTKGARNGMHNFYDATLFSDDPEVRIDGDVNLFDLTPTMLDLLDVDYDAAEFDGRSLA